MLTSALMDQNSEYSTDRVTIGHGQRVGTVTITSPKLGRTVTDLIWDANPPGWTPGMGRTPRNRAHWLAHGDTATVITSVGNRNPANAEGATDEVTQ